jgi:transposase-like protein
LQRNGKIRLQPVVYADKKTLLPLIAKNVSKDATIVTDGLPAYTNLGSTYKLHVVVNHAKDEWTKGEFSTNTIEGFWSLFKRGIFGIYHQTSTKHLQRYCDEFSCRYNKRMITDSERFEEMMSYISCRLKYKDLIA